MYRTKDPTNIGQTTVILIWIWLASEIISHGVSLFAIFVLGGLGGPAVDYDRLDLAETLTIWTSGVTLLVFSLTTVATGRWIFVTNRNAQSVSDQVGITPGWAIGWFFVPVANLIKPFQGVSATWRATVAPDDIDSVDVPILLRWWWGLWLATCIWGNIDFRVSLVAETPEELITSYWIAIATLLIDIPLACVLVTIVKRLSAMQSQLLASSPVPIPPDADSI
jgi:hypothetical protein